MDLHGTGPLRVVLPGPFDDGRVPDRPVKPAALTEAGGRLTARTHCWAHASNPPPRPTDTLHHRRSATPAYAPPSSRSAFRPVGRGADRVLDEARETADPTCVRKLPPGRGRGRFRCGGVAEAEPQVLDVEEGLFQKLGDVAVVEGVDDGAATAFPGDEPEIAQQAELVGAGGGFHAHSIGEVAYRARAFLEAGEDVQPRRGGQGLEGGSDVGGPRRVQALAGVAWCLSSAP